MLNFMSWNCPELQVPTKPCRKDMVKPRRWPWKKVKRVAWHVLERKRVVWEFGFRDQRRFSI